MSISHQDLLSFKKQVLVSSNLRTHSSCSLERLWEGSPCPLDMQELSVHSHYPFANPGNYVHSQIPPFITLFPSRRQMAVRMGGNSSPGSCAGG